MNGGQIDPDCVLVCGRHEDSDTVEDSLNLVWTFDYCFVSRRYLRAGGQLQSRYLPWQNDDL